MKQVIIDNPILNSPFEEPKRHFRFTEDGITNEIIEERRISAYFIPVAQPKKKGKQIDFETEWTEDRLQENKFINQIRAKVAKWREGGYRDVTKTTRYLLDYWRNPERDKKLFFCQIEALETAIYLAEVAQKCGDGWIEKSLRQANESANAQLFRIAFKMATGSGKTVVMAMLIAWQALNKLANTQDARFADTFLIITPGITIKDRLRVLLPSDPQNYYRQRDVLPPDLCAELSKSKIIITNFHALKRREIISAGKLTKQILRQNGEQSAFTESPDQMVRRVCRELGNKKNIIVINDEAHHCYRRKSDVEGEKLTGDERKEAQKREEEARVWISGIEAVKSKLGVKVVYDLSATPFFLKGSGYPEGTLFPWVVSDFSLIDAIEAGLVKVPRVPVADDSMTGAQPTYRNIWVRIREDLPRKGRRTEAISGGQKLPVELEGALNSLYGNYRKYYEQWEKNTEARAKGLTAPVFIVVCNNTNVSKMLYDYIAGWEKEMSDGSKVAVPGKFDIFSNVENNKWTSWPNTILIDSEQLESGEAMSDEFKKVAATEIEEFKAECRARFPGRDVDEIEDEDILREVMNTVGKTGKLGENIRCVISVSMLTEGWDANTVTHVLGIRAFGTQLLCEQVVGRALRRMSYAVNDQGHFNPEYAEVYGVPFSFIPCSGAGGEVGPPPQFTHIRALADRIACEITFPRLVGYRYDLPKDTLKATFTNDSRLALSTADLPTKTENAPIVGESSIHTLDDLKARRMNEVAFLLAKLTLEKYFRQDGLERKDHTKEHKFDNEVQSWLFPQVLGITKQWLDECVTCKDNTFPQLLLLVEWAHDAADRIYQSIVRSSEGENRILPILRPYDTIGTTRYVDFDTTRPVYSTDPARCHVSHVVADTDSWEQKMAQTLEDMDEVVCYVKNQNLGFTIPYTLEGDERNYTPDFIVRLDDGHGKDDLLNLVLEVSGESRKDKAAKASTARTLWVPAINHHGGFGRWAYIEITDPWDAKNTIRALIDKTKTGQA